MKPFACTLPPTPSGFKQNWMCEAVAPSPRAFQKTAPARRSARLPRTTRSPPCRDSAGFAYSWGSWMPAVASFLAARMSELSGRYLAGEALAPGLG